MTQDSTKRISGAMGWSVTVVRLVIACLFLFSGTAKLHWVSLGSETLDPLTFARAIHAFEMLHNDMIPFATYAFPWIEILCAGALLLGVWTKGAAMVINMLLVVFCLAMLTVISRRMEAECGCFGQFLGTEVGWIAIGRNVFLLAMTTFVVWKGPGRLAVLGSAE